MIEKIIQWSVENRFLVIMLALVLLFSGVVVVKNTPVDAIPDLSDVQVIIKTDFSGQSPRVVEDQVTYPITTAMLSVPGASTVRGYSFFGTSYVYVIFDDDTDIYWARSRVLEYLSQISSQLPENAKPELGPDATGVGWVYIYSLIDKSGKHDIADLTSLQNWFLKFELQNVKGVSEVATVGGMVKQYQIKINPDKLIAYNIPLQHISMSIEQNNSEIGASVIEMSEAEYMISVGGYLRNLEDIKKINISTSENGEPVFLENVAEVTIGPQMRRGVSELNGEGEAVGGIIVMRYGENAQKTINLVKEKLETLKKGLPDGVEVITVYDRSQLISHSVNNLKEKLVEEFIIVTLICIIFLFHFRSSLVAVISLPIGILVSFIVMYFQGINANIMSLGGIAIAIGAMVDGAVVLVENMHKHMEKENVTKQNRWQIVIRSASEVGPALFFSLLIITVSFVPVFTLEAQEGKMFAPLAFTKTYAMAASAILAITLVPVLMGYCVRGKIISEHKNPLNRFFNFLYVPTLNALLKFPKTTILAVLILCFVGFSQVKNIGSEFIPTLDEGDLMYMPSTYPGISIGKARELLQQTDKLIKTIPEVENVFGKVGRANTATDPAPLTMIETFIQLKPKSQWREGMTKDDLKKELDSIVKIPGVTNAWVEPIKTRIDMLSTGLKTPVGVKISGNDIFVIEKIGKQLEEILNNIEGTDSVYSERTAGGRYLKVDINREKIARYGMSVKDIQQMISSSVGGMNVSQIIEGLERYPINMRYPQDYRDSPEKLRNLTFVNQMGQVITLGEVADIYIEDGPGMIKSENARVNGWILISTEVADLQKYVENAREIVNKELNLPVGYSISWSGQYEYMQRAKEKLGYIVPLTFAIIILLLYINFRNITDVILVLATIPMSMVGGIWTMNYLGFNLSVATVVGFIALAGVSVEIGVIMLSYLKQAVEKSAVSKTTDEIIEGNNLKDAIISGASMRVRAVLMTSLSIIIGLMPALSASGTGAEIMSRIAAPMVGGMFSVMILTLLIVPVVYYLTVKNKVFGKYVN